jgi:hypothetical protein
MSIGLLSQHTKINIFLSFIWALGAMAREMAWRIRTLLAKPVC